MDEKDIENRYLAIYENKEDPLLIQIPLIMGISFFLLFIIIAVLSIIVL